jgi:hypothetical protein
VADNIEWVVNGPATLDSVEFLENAEAARVLEYLRRELRVLIEFTPRHFTARGKQ